MENRYEIIMYWSKDDNSVIAEVPEIQCCMVNGGNYNDALQNIQVVINEWIETAKSLNRPIPLPKGKLIYA